MHAASCVARSAQAYLPPTRRGAAAAISDYNALLKQRFLSFPTPM